MIEYDPRSVVSTFGFELELDVAIRFLANGAAFIQVGGSPLRFEIARQLQAWPNLLGLLRVLGLEDWDSGRVTSWEFLPRVPAE